MSVTTGDLVIIALLAVLLLDRWTRRGITAYKQRKACACQPMHGVVCKHGKQG